MVRRNRQAKLFGAKHVPYDEGEWDMRDYLTYGEEWREGLHAEFELKRRAASRELAAQGHSQRRKTVETLLLVIYIFLEFLS